MLCSQQTRRLSKLFAHRIHNSHLFRQFALIVKVQIASPCMWLTSLGESAFILHQKRYTYLFVNFIVWRHGNVACTFITLTFNRIYNTYCKNIKIIVGITYIPTKNKKLLFNYGNMYITINNALRNDWKIIKLKEKELSNQWKKNIFNFIFLFY